MSCTNMQDCLIDCVLFQKKKVLAKIALLKCSISTRMYHVLQNLYFGKRKGGRGDRVTNEVPYSNTEAQVVLETNTNLIQTF